MNATAPEPLSDTNPSCPLCASAMPEKGGPRVFFVKISVEDDAATIGQTVYLASLCCVPCYHAIERRQRVGRIVLYVFIVLFVIALVAHVFLWPEIPILLYYPPIVVFCGGLWWAAIQHLAANVGIIDPELFSQAKLVSRKQFRNVTPKLDFLITLPPGQFPIASDERRGPRIETSDNSTIN